MAYARIHIQNFGPIREGSFELRPLTIFIGPNNSGKTYAATAAYEMVNALAFERRYRQDRLSELTFGDVGSKHHMSHEPSDGTRLGDEILNQVRQHLETIVERIKVRLVEGLLDAFAVESLTSMMAAKDLRRTLEVSLVDPLTDRPVLGVRGGPLRDLAFDDLELRGLSLVGVDEADETTSRRTHDGYPNDEIANEIWGDKLDDLGLPSGRGMYLPASRLGIIQGWTVLAASAIRSLRQSAGRIRDELPPAPGVYGDFFERLVTLGTLDLPRPEYPKHFLSAATLLESNVIQGQIIRESTSLGIMRLIYRTPEFDLPLERASSTVGDMAPLAIALKEQLAQGDLLVIDEPEAHLYPANERRVARVLARVSRAGVRVIVPTHSSTIVHQVSNMVQSRLLSPSQRAEVELSEEDVLSPDDVGLYQFISGPDGVVIQEIKYDPEFGYPEEGFYEVAEALSDESIEIESRLPVLSA